ncbi:hypothetical protein [Neorhodopirellula pilleata]|uniref:Uncharacterized protein n=1 Tax=Neorhodopirellula pilleata TaxID=2714738 RepID=A0A5C6A4K2_9BACT|nr:hypothetical protein [Neorhodopirellula pilleata]TWT94228.1 hypothetical protein Pla100_38380 [Neorhodopirellula pilleata]
MMRLSETWASRRVRFQLTPLMDLLLIIVFAQFLDVRETAQQQTLELQSEREKLTLQIARERSELAGIQQAVRQRQAELERQRDQARASRDDAIEQARVQASEMQVAMDMITEYFEIDESAITRTTPLDDATDEYPVEQAIRSAAALADSSPDAVIRFLIGHAELLKRAEIWTVHADETRRIRIQAGQQEASFRLESKTQTDRTTEVADRLFAAYKQFPQPKGLVVLLVSFDPQSVAGVYQPLIDAIPSTLERLRADTPESRFEYTVLGPTPNPINSAEQAD